MKSPVLVFLLFLFHPTAVISAAWMIQIKTLLCFTFGFGAVLVLLEKKEGLRWYILTSLLFILSVASKSASLPLAIILIFLIIRQRGYKRTYLWLPFLLVTLMGGYRLFKSPVTMEGVLNAKELNQENSVKHNQGPISLNYDLVLQTMNYYFWQTLVPADLGPVKGTNSQKANILDYVHLFFLSAVIIILWRDKGVYYLLFGHVLLLPFLGVIPAPFMNITWVSDQHLYMALPLLIAFWLRLLEKIEIKHLTVIPVLFVIVFIYTSWKTTPYYRDSISFYEKSLETNPFNVPIIYNLAMDRIYRGEKDKAFELLEKSYELAQYEPSMKKNVYFPYLVQLYLQVRQKREQNEN
jgi:tetratricopeptide (TPR) repeat protein